MKNRNKFLSLAALVAAALWTGLLPAQNVTFARAPRPAGSSSRRPTENHATELRDCISQAYGRGAVQLGQPMQQAISGSEFRRRFDTTPRCGRVGWREALARAIESRLVEGGGTGGGSIARVPPPPPLTTPPPVPSPGPVATEQQVVAAAQTGHRVVIVERPADAGSSGATPVDAGADADATVVPPPRPQRCNGRCDAGADADASDR